MCDASDYAVGAVLGKKIKKHFKPIHYASKIMNQAQDNYTTNENELLAIVFAFNKFRQYLVLSKTIIRDKKGAKNLIADDLSQLENPDLGKLTKAEIRDLFPKERLTTVSDNNNDPWRVSGDEAAQILGQCHSGPLGGHHGIATIARKVFEAGLYWPHIFRDARRLFLGKLKSGWHGPYLISKDLENGAIELYNEGGNEFIVNRQRVKPYQKDVLEVDKHDDITLDDEGEVT
nr:retrovirus-related Pol polyprotein from transposon 17.6 [Tanacetum cinerariifolium]